MKRALPFVAVVALAGCGSSHQAQSKPKPPRTPVLSRLLARAHSVHFVLDGTIKVDEQSFLSHLHQVPPLHLHAAGAAARGGLKGSGSLKGEVSGSGTLVVAGTKAYARAAGTWYDLGQVETAAHALRGAQWERAGNSLRGTLHLSTGQLEQLSGVSMPFGVDGAHASVTIRLSRWGDPVAIKPPGTAVPLPSG